jgi:WD40 repeat protein
MPKISLSLAILNDNNLLASSFEDNTIRFANMNVTSISDIQLNDSIILKGHTHFVKVITALNKTILASGSCDNTIILWDILLFKQINNLTGHTGCINALISIPYGNSNLLISGSSDSKIKVWLSNGTELKSNDIDYFENNKPVNALAYGFLDYCAFIASASDENFVKIWSHNDLIYEKQTINIKNITFLTIINKTLIVTVNSINNLLDQIKVWNNKLEQLISFDSTTINSIKELSNGNLAVGTKKTVEIYDLDNLNLRLIQRLNHSFEVKLMDSSVKTLITANSEKDKTELTIWNLETYESKKNAILRGNTIAITILLNETIAVLSSDSKNYWFYIFDQTFRQIFFKEYEIKFDSLIKLKKNNNLVIGSSSIGLIEIWDTESKSLNKTLYPGYSVTLLVEFKNYLISSHQTGLILVWDLDLFMIKAKIESELFLLALQQLDDSNLISISNELLVEWKFSEKLGIDLKHSLTGNITNPIKNPITALLFFSNKKLLAGSSDYIHVWDDNFKYFDALKGHEKQITCLISLNNHLFASASEDSVINLWSEENTISISLSKSHNSKINSLVYNSNLNIIISGSMDGQIMIWQNTTNLTFKEELIGHSKQIEHLIFLDKNTIASASDDNTILIWNKSKIEFNLTSHTDSINSLTKLTNGNLASCSKDKTIRIWDIKNDFRLIATLYGHLRSVICIKSIDDKRLVSGSCDRKIIVWDITTNYIIKEINDAHSDCINTLAIYDGFLLSGSDDKTLKKWDLANFEWTNETLNQTYSVKSIAINNIYIAINKKNDLNIFKNYPEYKLIKNLTGHTNSIYSLVIIPSNENIISGSRDGTIKVWNSTIFQLIATLTGHTGWINVIYSLAIIPSNENIVSGYYDGTIKVWNSKTFKLIANLTGHTDWVMVLVVVPSNENIISGSRDYTIKVWNSKTFELIANLTGHTSYVRALAIIPSNESIVSGYFDGTIKVWNSTTFKLIANLTGHTEKVNALAIIPSNENIISGSRDNTIKVWNSKTFKLIASFLTRDVIALVIIPSNENIVSSSYDKTIKVWNSKTFKLIANLKGYTNSVESLAIIPSNENIVSGSDDGTIKVWNSDNFIIKKFQDCDAKKSNLKFLKTNLEYSHQIYSLAIMPSNENIISGSSDGSLKVWNSTTLKLISTLSEHISAVNALAIIPSNENIVSGSDDKIIKVWNSTTFKLIANLTGHTEKVNALAIIPSNENIVSSSGDYSIRVWNSSSFQSIAFLTGITFNVRLLTIIPSNENIVSGSYFGSIKVWNSTTFKLIASLPEYTDWVTSLAIIPPNENIIYGSDDNTIRVLNSTTFKLIATLSGHTDWVISLAFIPSNENIISGSRDYTIKVWNSKTFELIANLTGHINSVQSLAIIPSNENIISGSYDKTIRVWDHSYSFFSDEILDLTFLSNFHLATGSANGIIRIWNIYTCEIISEYINNDKNRKHILLDFYPDTGDLAFGEARSIKIFNTGLLYSNFSNIN